MRRKGSDSTIDVVNLAAEAQATSNTALVTDRPGGITAAVRLVSGQDSYGFAEPFVMYPPASLSGNYPRPNPAPTGMFDGVSLGKEGLRQLVQPWASNPFHILSLPPCRSWPRTSSPPPR